MRVTVIYETMNKGSTYACVKLILNQLKTNIDINVDEFFLSKCISESDFNNNIINFTTEQEKFNYLDFTKTISKSLEKSDLIIVAYPPNYFKKRCRIDTFLTELSYNYDLSISKDSMINTIGLIISNPNDHCLFTINKNAKNNLRFLGLKKIFEFSNKVTPMGWENMNLRRKEKICNKIYEASSKLMSFNNRLYDINRFHNISYMICSDSIKRKNINKITELRDWRIKN